MEAAGIHVPFFIVAGAIVLGIAILSTARKPLDAAERLQAEQVTAPVETVPRPAAPGPSADMADHATLSGAA